MNISEQFIKDLIDQGVDTFFGVQGGACARLVDNVVKYKGRFIPVLNEQSAGFYAHGYHMSSGKTAGLIFTTGPGLTNGISGIAACYYDRVPLVVLVGQVGKKLNIAKKTSTRMVGFQEVPHLDLCNPISDSCLKIDSEKKYLNSRDDFLRNLHSKVQVVEFLDDVQRTKIQRKFPKYKSKSNIKSKSHSKKILELIKKSINPTIILGAGCSHDSNSEYLTKIITKTKINTCCTWGAQNLQKYFSENNFFYGLMGNHNPGIANKILVKSDLILAVGCSLLQHQAGKDLKEFAKNSKIIFVNNDLRECKRAAKQFGKRLIIHNVNAKDFIISLKNIRKANLNVTPNISLNKTKYPVNILKTIFKKISKNSIIFADAGATLSWTFQAANSFYMCPSIFTSFNLHSMGYANCASIGAKVISKKNIFCIIGDGSVPMNSQEFSWIKKYPFKMIIIDNNGYGIIRQTQRAFYKSKFYGSDFLNKDSKMPNFSLEKILSSYLIDYKVISKKKINNKDINWFLASKKSKALIIKIDYNSEVSTEV